VTDQETLDRYFDPDVAAPPSSHEARTAWRRLRRRMVGPTSPALEAAQRSTEHATRGAGLPVPR
jgi:hypothetical protein